MKRFLITALTLLISFTLVQAQTDDRPDLVTDRPDQTESALTVPVKHLQIETGAVYTRVNSSVSEFTYNTTLLRFGILPWAELRLVQEYGRQQFNLDGGELEQKGFSPLTLGTKIHIVKERGLIPETALMYEIELPTGSDAFRPEEETHFIRALFSYTLNEWIDLGYNLGARFPNEQDRITTVYTLSFAFKMTDKLTAFTEVYGALENNEKNRHAADGGFTYLLRPNLQLDLSGGFGLSDTADDGFVSAGLSWRIPR